jgi:lipopolysaccharide/colanic/teichoic acid biosynthesis glycosyltransferase
MIFRAFDFLLSIIGLVFGAPVFVAIYLVAMFDTGAPLFFQKRIGRFKKPFILVKFRTMRQDTDNVPTHLAPASSVTRLGYFLRRTKLDELPQLWNVLVGDMSLVGPRPGLPSHTTLIDARDCRGVFKARPGITGLSQLKGIDMSTPDLLAETDAEMLRKLALSTYFEYIFLTLIGRGRGDRIR